MQLIGKLVRREGTQLVFGSQKKPEWRPMDIGGGASEFAYQAQPGEYYQIDVEHNTIMAMRNAPERSPAPGGGVGQGSAPQSAPQSHTGGHSPEKDLLITTVALAKSHIEHSGTMPAPEQLVEDAAKLQRAVKQFLSPSPQASAGAPPTQVEEDIPW